MNNTNINTVYGFPLNGDGSFFMKAEVELYPLYKKQGEKRTEDGALRLTVATHPIDGDSHNREHGHSVLLLKEQALELVELLQRQIANIKD